jgi:hypothetical protein
MCQHWESTSDFSCSKVKSCSQLLGPRLTVEKCARQTESLVNKTKNATTVTVDVRRLEGPILGEGNGQRRTRLCQKEEHQIHVQNVLIHLALIPVYGYKRICFER